MRDPRVEAWIEALPDWQAEIFRELRELIHEAEPAIDETIKRTTQPYFVLDGNVCAFLAAKDHCNLFLYDGAIVPDPDHIITAGHDNLSARQIAFTRGGTIPREPLVAMLRQIAANNRAGGWRKLKGAGAGLTTAGEPPSQHRGQTSRQCRSVPACTGPSAGSSNLASEP